MPIAGPNENEKSGATCNSMIVKPCDSLDTLLEDSFVAATLRFLQFFSLGTWVGSILYFSFVVTRGAFSVLPNNDLAGALVGYTLSKLHILGIVAGVVYLVATAAVERSVGALAHPAALLVFAMIVFTMASQYSVIARMDVLRAQMGSVDATPAGNPLREAFDRLHQYSVWLESAVLLSGLVALFLTARQKTS
jgi:uncharacterized protein DUF4149